MGIDALLAGLPDEDEPEPCFINDDDEAGAGDDAIIGRPKMFH